MTLEILYRDEAVVAIHQPSGLLVHRSDIDRHETRFALQMLREQLGQKVWLAHRLDRGTSGVLLFGLDAQAAAGMARQFEAQQVEKRYLAIVRGHPAEAGSIDHPLRRIMDPMQCRAAAPSTSQAAITQFTRLAVAELQVAVDRYPTSRYALLELLPKSGRRHQLRRHLKHISHPIIGDATYGKGRHNRMFAERFAVARMLLACTRISLQHPVLQRPLALEAPPDADFMRVVAGLGWSPAALPDSVRQAATRSTT
jgi:tRNA pseudouridine65 synthase